MRAPGRARSEHCICQGWRRLARSDRCNRLRCGGARLDRRHREGTAARGRAGFLAGQSRPCGAPCRARRSARAGKDDLERVWKGCGACLQPRAWRLPTYAGRKCDHAGRSRAPTEPRVSLRSHASPCSSGNRGATYAQERRDRGHRLLPTPAGQVDYVNPLMPRYYFCLGKVHSWFSNGDLPDGSRALRTSSTDLSTAPC